MLFKMYLYNRMAEVGDIILINCGDKFNAKFDDKNVAITEEVYKSLLNIKKVKEEIEYNEKELNEFKYLLTSGARVLTDFNYSFNSKLFAFYAYDLCERKKYLLDYTTFNLCTKFAYAGKILK